LKLSAQQVEKVRSLLDFAGRPPSNEEAAAVEKDLGGVLEPKQTVRLEQIIRQTRGLQALLDPETAHALDLTERQKEQIQNVLDSARPGPGHRGPGGPPHGHGGPRPERGGHGPEGEEKATSKQVLGVLTGEQRTNWRALVGEPFRGNIHVPPQPRPPRVRGTTRFTYWEGDWSKLPDFKKLKPGSKGTGPAFDLGLARRSENYAFKFEGFFKLESAGETTFTLSSDDGSQLFIDDELVVDNDGGHLAQTRRGTMMLARGSHKVTLTYFQNKGPATLSVQIESPGLGRRNLSDLVSATAADADRPGFPLRPG
jgi:hypothetical protein